MQPSNPESLRAAFLVLALLLFVTAGFFGAADSRNISPGLAGAGFAIAGGLVVLATTRIRPEA